MERDAARTDFGSRYWRASTPVDGALAQLTDSTIDLPTLRLFADNLPTLCWIANGDGYIVWYNLRWHDYCGSTAEQMEGWGWQTVHDPAMLDSVLEGWTASIATGEPFEMTFPLRGADGIFRPFLTRILPIRDATGNVVRWFGVNTDVSDKIAADDALRESEAYVRLLLDSTSEAFYSLTTEGVTTSVNSAFLKMLGFAGAEAAIGRKLHDVIHHSHPDGTHYAVVDCPIYRAAAQGIAAHVTNELFYRLDGTSVPVEYRAEPIVRDGKLIGAICTFFDITDRMKAEKRQALFFAIADRQSRLSDPRAIVRETVTLLGEYLGVSRTGFGEISSDGETVTYISDHVDGVAHLIGTFPIMLFGQQNIAELRLGMTTVYPDVTDDPRTADADFAAIETRAAVAVPLIRDEALRAVLYVNHKDVRAWPPEDVALVQDVAARTWDTLERARVEAELRELNATLEKRVEDRTAELQVVAEALRQAQKMEAVGQLTGGIAHDFNNMLAVVLGSLDLLQRRISTDDPRAKRYIESATEGARRAATLTQRLLAFSRQQPLQPEPIDVNRLVTGMSDLLRRSLGGAVELETVLAGGLWPVHADPNQLENIILNLGINGRDAMPGGGRMTIETQNAHLDERYAVQEIGVASGQYVMIAVTDSGTGMSREVIAKAFDPFFTTKEVGKGTGLGLSQVYGFIKQSGGHVKIYSEVGHGTTIKIYLPRLVGIQLPTDARSLSNDLVMGDRQELILVVEDEPAVRQFSVAALDELGYRVIQADGADQALLLLEQYADVSLMFTDIVMPGINGAKLAEAARVLRPGLKVLFTTGYTRNAVVHNGVLDAGVALIGKPFTVEELAAKVRHVLDEAAVSP